jgi:hypothetical protein
MVRDGLELPFEDVLLATGTPMSNNIKVSSAPETFSINILTGIGLGGLC